MKTTLKWVVGVSLFSLTWHAPARAALFFSQDSNPNGLFAINTTTGTATLAGAGFTGVSGATVGLATSGTPGVLFGGMPFGLLRINIDGSGSTLVGSQGMEGLGYDALTNTLYGQLNNQFFTVNQATGAIATTLATAPSDMDGLDFGNGLVYGLSDLNNSLYSYLRATNTWSLIGNTGVNWNNPGLAYDPTSNVLYAIGDEASTNLYRINPVTAAATVVGPTGLANDEGGLAFIVPEPSTLLMALGTIAPLTVGGRRRRKG
jgi:hypothetical protein